MARKKQIDESTDWMALCEDMRATIQKLRAELDLLNKQTERPTARDMFALNVMKDLMDATFGFDDDDAKFCFQVADRMMEARK